MRLTFDKLEKKYLDLLDKRENGEQLDEMEEYALNSIIELRNQAFSDDCWSVERFFTAIDRLLEAEKL